uniref:Vomeronasal type-1 receptor n=1 Tax=Ornithorhynchus anatinus TaxID=9258 RepID=F7DBY7_ORNAN
MPWGELVLTIVFLAQTGMGLLGNSALLVVYVRVFISQPHRKKPTDLILTHLTAVNVVTLLTQGVPSLIFATGIENIWEEAGCQLLTYIRRVTRGLSICTTCLLSVFQAITISPSTSRCAQFKSRAPKYILPSFLFFWILNLSIYMNLLTTTIVIKNVTITVSSLNIKYCSNIFWMKYLNDMMFLSIITLRDVVFVFLMGWSSGYMVMVLHRHRKQVQHIHSSSLSPRSSPGSRATQTILLLVTSFICFYWINCSFNLASNFVEDKDFKLNDIVTFLGACYPSLCPLVLINSDPPLRWIHYWVIMGISDSILLGLRTPAVSYFLLTVWRIYNEVTT